MLQLAVGDTIGLDAWLRSRKLLTDAQQLVTAGRAGEGNMNLVLRAELDDGATLVVKQARPWVEKYPDIPAPVERLLAEVDFYRAIAPHTELAARMPALLHVDEATNVAVFEDLGDAADLTGIYRSAVMDPADLDGLLQWLSTLHRLQLQSAAWPRLRNDAMRALNHAHVFDIPLQSDGPDVEPFCTGLGTDARTLRADGALHERARALGAHYLRTGPALMHGDFYPGSWLATRRGPMVIDPEFGGFGAPEFDLGVLMAHLVFAGMDPEALSGYRPPPGFDSAVARGFAGMELIRRLLGVAQLPLQADLRQRRGWLDLAQTWVQAA